MVGHKGSSNLANKLSSILVQQFSLKDFLSSAVVIDLHGEKFCCRSKPEQNGLIFGENNYRKWPRKTLMLPIIKKRFNKILLSLIIIKNLPFTASKLSFSLKTSPCTFLFSHRAILKVGK